MIYKSLIGSSALMLTMAAPNMTKAADLPDATQPDIYASAPAADHDWSGFYVGGHGGLAAFWYDGDYEGDNLEDDGPLVGALLGVQGGYNHEVGDWLWGVEADFSWLFNADDNFSNVGGETGTIEMDWIATLRGRGGITSDRSLVYLTGGVALGHAESTFEGQNDDSTHVGVVGGAGLEYAFSDHWSARGEADYIYFFDQDQNNADGEGISFNGLRLTLGLNYKF